MFAPPAVGVHDEVPVPALAPPALEQCREGLRIVCKHLLDRFVSLLLLLLTFPLFVVLAVVVRLTFGGPVLFRQVRVGRRGASFTMFKFRSMRMNPADPHCDEIEDLPPDTAPGAENGVAVSRVGSFLRRTSLDELPQLVNVLQGHMSLVGPRPERPGYVERFTGSVDGYSARHRMKPGMTGLAQVQGLRGKTSLRQRVAADNRYIDNWSPWLDVRILLWTSLVIWRYSEFV